MNLKILDVLKWILIAIAVGIALFITRTTDTSLASTLLWAEIAILVVVAVLFSFGKKRK